MKKLILTLFLLISVSGFILASSVNISHEEKEIIELDKGNKDKGSADERSALIVQAYVYSSASIVEVELFNIGTATVTITNSYGDIVCSTSANTSLPVVLNLAIPSEGDTYFIEISSANWYASGFFNL